MDDIFWFIFGLISLALLFLTSRNLVHLMEKRAKWNYNLKYRQRLKEDSEEYENEQDNRTARDLGIPSWLIPIIEGAGLSPEKLVEGDIQELLKAKIVLDKFISQKSGQSQNEGLILE